MGHVNPELVGFGLRIAVRGPFEMGRLWSDERVVIAQVPPTKQALIAPPSAPGERPEVMFKGVESLRELADYFDIPFSDGWVLWADRLAIPWPRPFHIGSTVQDVSWAFELFEPGQARDAMIYVQGPHLGVPPLGRLVGEGMAIAQRGTGPRGPWMDLVYTRAGVLWTQRRAAVDLGRGEWALVTAQANPAAGPAIFAGADELVAGLAWSDL
jgi:hypothetical protein